MTDVRNCVDLTVARPIAFEPLVAIVIDTEQDSNAAVGAGFAGRFVLETEQGAPAYPFIALAVEREGSTVCADMCAGASVAAAFDAADLAPLSGVCRSVRVLGVVADVIDVNDFPRIELAIARGAAALSIVETDPDALSALARCVAMVPDVVVHREEGSWLHGCRVISIVTVRHRGFHLIVGQSAVTTCIGTAQKAESTGFAYFSRR